jgi:hypothetical protein
VRVRIPVELALLCALSVCTTQNNLVWAARTTSSPLLVAGICVDVTNVQEQPTFISPSFSFAKALPLFSRQSVSSDALRFSKLALKITPVDHSYGQTESKPYITIVTPGSLSGARATLGNNPSC